jgi:plastocyanin
MKRLALSLGLVALATITAACSGGSATSPTPAPSVAADAIVIVAKDLAFQPTEVAAPADEAFSIVLDNQEDLPHNIQIKDASGAEVFNGEIIQIGQVTYDIPALAAGSYPFLCQVHPDMTGTITAS